METINIKDMFNQLLNAACTGDADTVHRLISEARGKGGDEMVQELLVMRDDEYGCKLVEHAWGRQQEDIVKFLVDEGAEYLHVSASGPTRIKTIKKKLTELKPYLKDTYGITRIGVFGSRVRGDYREDSDLDVLIEYDGTLGLLAVSALQDFLSENLGIKVDLVKKKLLKKRIGEVILGEVEYV